MKMLRWLFLLGLLALEHGIYAQAKLSISPASLDSLPSTAIFNDTSFQPAFSVKIYNKGNAAFLDTLFIYHEIGADTIPSAVPNPNSGIDYSLDTATIAPGDSIYKMLTFHFTSPAFSIGPSVVVIWPGGNGIITLDSVSKLITLDSTATAINEPANEKLKIYLSCHQLYIDGNGENTLNRVRIFDVQGSLFLEQKVSAFTTIPMMPYASGIYFVELVFNDDSTKTYKVFNAAVY